MHSDQPRRVYTCRWRPLTFTRWRCC